MSNPMLNPQPNYSGVTIQIANPTVNAIPPQQGYPVGNGSYATCPQICCCPPQYYGDYSQMTVRNNESDVNKTAITNGYPPVYPAEYYMNDYGRHNSETVSQTESGNRVNVRENSLNESDVAKSSNKRNINESGEYSEGRTSDTRANVSSAEKSVVNERNSVTENNSQNDRIYGSDNSVSGRNHSANEIYSDKDRKSEISAGYDEKNNDRYNDRYNAGTDSDVNNQYYSGNNSNGGSGSAVLKHYDDGRAKLDGDLTKSNSIIEDIDERDAKIKEEKKNAKDSKIVALTDEYIKSLENYLNNPNDEIRLMASKEILTRLDEDKDRYNDAALNALLNKMLQDPSKLVRIAALSAFGSQLACGNDYTVQLLHNIQANPSADKEDVLQAADILLKMSAGTEVKHIPNPDVKNNKK